MSRTNLEDTVNKYVKYMISNPQYRRVNFSK